MRKTLGYESSFVFVPLGSGAVHISDLYVWLSLSHLQSGG